MEAKIAELKESEERYKEFIRMHETIIQHLKEENEMLRKRNADLEAKIKRTEKTIEEKREIANYDKFMISFRKET
jgi:chromosome segregation ATPase